jgi:hypothetical protein
LIDKLKSRRGGAAIDRNAGSPRMRGILMKKGDLLVGKPKRRQYQIALK